jgi:hypothetical protein
LLDKGKPLESVGRKTTGLSLRKDLDMAAGLPGNTELCLCTTDLPKNPFRETSILFLLRSVIPVCKPETQPIDIDSSLNPILKAYQQDNYNSNSFPSLSRNWSLIVKSTINLIHNETDIHRSNELIHKKQPNC